MPDRRGLPAIGVALLVLGAVTAGVGYVRHRATRRAIRAGQLPRDGWGPAAVTVGVLVLAVLLIAAAVL
ncbi:hypothetical protein Val02_86350 [Virgisporangium aliadipatigenens]|uniref:DUF202 domain-containing protein n=1 Tax=Virgisporangium aliadipatigenens TaxID=741659 RepID=A0A8J3YU75_9ACTN|nr:hypothetical protein Val02_86350 [Virgisporangium aliadipatigenens]